MPSLDIWVGDRKVAQFDMHREGDGSDRYVVEYVKNAKSEELVSLTMVPLAGRQRHELRTFPPCFDMILPEGERAERIRQARKIIPSDPFSLLSYVGGNPVNRVRFLPTGQRPSESPTPLPAPKEILGCEHGLRLFKQLIDDLDLRQGIAGVQPKILGKAAEDNTKFSFHPRNFRGNTHILKASTERYPFLAANEEACLRVFRAAGLETSEAVLSADGQLLLVKRFDVTEDNVLGFEEVASLMGETSDTKYRRDYGSMLETVAQYLKPVDEYQARAKLFQAIVLNSLLGNGDAHLKNFGVLYADDTEVQLAPFYDCISTLPYIADDVPALALSGDHYSKAWWPRGRLEEFGRKHGKLTDREIGEIFDRSFSAIAAGVDHLADLSKTIGGYTAIADQLRRTWNQRLDDFRAEPTSLKFQAPRSTPMSGSSPGMG